MSANFNGWANRETWLVNLHLGEVMYNDAVECLSTFNYETLEDFVEELARGYESMFEECCMPTETNPLLMDLLRNNDIFWLQLATNYAEQAVSDLNHVFPVTD